MSYSITFSNVPENRMTKYKVRFPSNEGISDFTKKILMYRIMTLKPSCMDIDDLCKNLYAIKTDIEAIVSDAMAEAYSCVYGNYDSNSADSPYGEFTIEGSTYRNRYDDDIDDLKEYVFEELYKKAFLIETPDYWTVNEKWCEKYSDVSELIGYLSEEAYIKYIKRIINDLYEYSDEFKEYNGKSGYDNNFAVDSPCNDENYA